MSSIKIGIFSECYRPTMNGVVVSIDTFKDALTKRGHEVFIFAPHTKNFADEDKKHIFRYPSIAYPGQGYYPLALPWLNNKNTLIESLGLDIIHCQHLFAMGKVGLKSGRHLKIPVVYTYHTMIADYAHYAPLFKGLVRNYIVHISEKFCNKCDTVVTPSESMKRVLRSYGVRAPIEVIPTGINPDKYKKVDPRVVKAHFHIQEEQHLLIYVGRLAQEKNIPVALEAIKLAVKEMPQIHLLLIGGGPEEATYKKWVRENEMSHHITFAGFLPKAETEKIFGAADLFIFPSVTDTQGIVIVEAMASGTPPVAANKMGPTDIIESGKDGILVEPKSAAFAKTIVKILNDKALYNKLKKAGVKKAKLYSSEVSADKMEKLYGTLTHQNNSR